MKIHLLIELVQCYFCPLFSTNKRNTPGFKEDQTYKNKKAFLTYKIVTKGHTLLINPKSEIPDEFRKAFILQPCVKVKERYMRENKI